MVFCAQSFTSLTSTSTTAVSREIQHFNARSKFKRNPISQFPRCAVVSTTIRATPSIERPSDQRHIGKVPRITVKVDALFPHHLTPTGVRRRLKEYSHYPSLTHQMRQQLNSRSFSLGLLTPQVLPVRQVSVVERPA